MPNKIYLPRNRLSIQPEVKLPAMFDSPMIASDQLATETGKRMLEKFSVAYDKMNATEDQIIKFGTLNSNNRGAQLWTSEGLPVVKDWNEAVDSTLAEARKLPVSAERATALIVIRALRWALGEVETPGRRGE